MCLRNEISSAQHLLEGNYRCLTIGCSLVIVASHAAALLYADRHSHRRCRRVGRSWRCSRVLVTVWVKYGEEMVFVWGIRTLNQKHPLAQHSVVYPPRRRMRLEIGLRRNTCTRLDLRRRKPRMLSVIGDPGRRGVISGLTFVALRPFWGAFRRRRCLYPCRHRGLLVSCSKCLLHYRAILRS